MVFKLEEKEEIIGHNVLNLTLTALVKFSLHTYKFSRRLTYQNQKISYVYFPSLSQPILISELKTVFAGSILNDAGLQRTKIQDVVTATGYLLVPEEQLSKIDGDIIFIRFYGNDDKNSLKKLKQKPLWKTLKAVQQNHVYLVDLSTWRGSNLIAADAVIDDLFKYLVNIP